MVDVIYMAIIIFYADTKPSEYFEGSDKDIIVMAFFTMKSIHFDKFKFLKQFKNTSKEDREICLKKIITIMEKIRNDVIIFFRSLNYQKYNEYGEDLRDILIEKRYLTKIGKKKIELKFKDENLSIQKKKFANMMSYSMELTNTLLELYEKRDNLGNGLRMNISEIRIKVDKLPYTSFEEFSAACRLSLEMTKEMMNVRTFKGGIYPSTDSDKNSVSMILADWFAAIYYHNLKPKIKYDNFDILTTDFIDTFSKINYY